MNDDSRKRIPLGKRGKFKGRGKLPPFIGIPKRALDSKAFGSLSAHATKLALDLARQYRGNNNGDFSAAWADMRQRGWRSPGTLHAAKKQLVASGFGLLTRQGGKNSCSLFALTWWPIDECLGKHDEMPTHIPLFLWEEQNKISSRHVYQPHRNEY
jgi:hypothetical protein